MSQGAQQQIHELSRQMWYLYQQGRYQQAIPFAMQTLDLVRHHLGREHLTYTDCLNSLGLLHRLAGEYAIAEPYLKEALQIRRETLEEAPPDLAQSLNNLALLYYSMGRYAEAEPLYKEAIDIWSRALGTSHPEFATGLNNLAELYRRMRRFTEAEQLHLQALALRRVVQGKNHPDVAQSLNTDVAQSLNNLAGLYCEMGRYIAAEPLYREALQIRRTVFDECHPAVAQSLNNLAFLHHSLGRYAEAEPLYRQASDIWREILGENHPEFAANLNVLGELKYAMGHLNTAEIILQRALEIRRRVLGNEHRDVAHSLSSLAALYRLMGDHRKAKLFLEQASDIWRKLVGTQHPAFAEILYNLAMLAQATGNVKAAKSQLREALGVYRSTFGSDHPNAVVVFRDLALLEIEDNLAEAESLLREALEMTQRTFGQEHPEFANSLGSLAALYFHMGEYRAAEPLFRQALEVRRRMQEEEHPLFSGFLKDLAQLCVVTGRNDEALTLLEQAMRIDDRTIGQVFSIGSESQRLAFCKTMQQGIDLFLSFALQCSHDSQVECAALDLVLRRKAIGTEVLAVQRDTVLGGRYPTLAPKLRELSTLCMQITRKTLAGPGPEGLQVHRQLLAEWHTQKEQLEAELAHQIPDMNLTQRLQAADRQGVACTLPQGTVLVELVRFPVFDFTAKLWGTARYIAFVLPADEPDNVRMIDLGEAPFIDQRIATFRTSLTAEPEKDLLAQDLQATAVDYPKQLIISPPEPKGRGLGTLPTAVETTPGDRVGTELRTTLFDPLLPAFGGCSRLLLSPDGDLTRLPFEVLPTEEGQRLIDSYHISYLSTGRDVLRFGAQPIGRPTEPLVVADPDFDLDDAKGKNTRDPIRHSQEFDHAHLHFDRLPGTRLEGEHLARMLKVKPWLEGLALEGQLKAQHSPHILHLATHGFFFKDQPNDSNHMQCDLETLVRQSVGSASRLRGPGMENPLLRSGLALAGANTWLKGYSPPSDAEDGLLTAEDVSGLDLLDTELVVLSACDTGLGEVRIGEGVFGLRRGFVLAGAKTLVMSLWKVPDRQTRELMEDFYHRILAGEGCAEALRQAQLTMKAKYSNPLYWGAFICQGDPGPLRQY